MAETTPKPAYGRRLMTSIIDDHAANDPTRPWLFHPRTSEPKDGWEPITYADGANAINRVAHKIIETSGRPSKGEFPTIAYIGPNDFRYIIFLFSAIKAGYQVREPLTLSIKLSLKDRTEWERLMCDQRPFSYPPATPTRAR